MFYHEVISDGRLPRQLLQSFERDGEFYVDRAGPWMRLQLGEGEWRPTGLSTSHILAGDPRVAAFVLAAVIGYHLHQPEPAAKTSNRCTACSRCGVRPVTPSSAGRISSRLSAKESPSRTSRHAAGHAGRMRLRGSRIAQFSSSERRTPCCTPLP